jgi:hypothetical protein
MRAAYPAARRVDSSGTGTTHVLSVARKIAS